MGSFYVNFTMRLNRSQALASELEAAGYRAYVTAPVDGFGLVAEEESGYQDDEAVEKLGIWLSSNVHSPVVCFMNHDDDQLLYWLFLGGKVVDSYDSAPEQLSGATNAAQGGGAALLVDHLNPAADAATIEATLRAARDHYEVESDRHLDLCRLLGLPRFTVGYSFEAAEQLYEDQIDPDLDCPKVQIYPANSQLSPE